MLTGCLADRVWAVSSYEEIRHESERERIHVGEEISEGKNPASRIGLRAGTQVKDDTGVCFGDDWEISIGWIRIPQGRCLRNEGENLGKWAEGSKANMG